jgi:TRAP-type mannitol/chloroaromatic compound transport system substrate-binding protein
VDVFMGVSYYWAQKEPAAPWFADVPFGVNTAGRVTWLLQGGGLKLWEEAYAPFNLVPRPGPSVGVQMAGWFRKKINTLADYKGLRMRIPGLGGRVVASAGGTVVLVPGGEIYAALERGVNDAAEWIGPHAT